MLLGADGAFLEQPCVIVSVHVIRKGLRDRHIKSLQPQVYVTTVLGVGSPINSCYFVAVLMRNVFMA